MEEVGGPAMHPKTRMWLNAALCVAAMALMGFFTFCSSACAYFQGSFLGLDLKVLGVVYMVALLALSLLKQEALLGLVLGAGLGGEVVLVVFQVRQGRYCPFCLSFGAIVALLFLLNFRSSRRWAILAALVVGYLVFLAFFKGSFVPKFKMDIPF